MTDAPSQAEKLKLAFWAAPGRDVAAFQESLVEVWAPALLERPALDGLQLHLSGDREQRERASDGVPQAVASVWLAPGTIDAERDAIRSAGDPWRPDDCARVDAWRVRELRAKRYARDWPDGTESPGVTQYSLMRPADGRTPDACSRHWREVHRPLALRIHVGLWNYVQDHVLETLTPAGGDVLGHAALHFRSHADLRDKLFDSEAGKREIFADIGNFMSLERTGVALMTERWLRTPASLRD